jgi:RHS repeat-associated protein
MLLQFGKEAARTDASGAGNFITDALGSTLALTDSSGSTLASYEYDPFGNTTVASGSSANSYEYTGRENDGTGLQFNRARNYSPTLQRFISEDPIGMLGSGSNLYAYVGNNPISFGDPFGTDKQDGLGKRILNYLWNNLTNGCGTSIQNICQGSVPLNPFGGLAGAAAAEAAAGNAAEASGAAAPSFLGQESGPAIPVPKGATGPYPTDSPGIQYNGGSGGNGLAGNVTDVRVMDPTPSNPNGYVNYGSQQANGGWQSVNPYTGQAVPPSSPWWHMPLK